MTLGEKQELFFELKARWAIFLLTKHPNWKFRPGEGRILQKGAHGIGRKAIDLATMRVVMVQDMVHKSDGCHYMGLAEDPQLFINKIHITKGEHPAWLEAGEAWENMDPLCCWGGRWGDANHISITHNGVK